MALKAYQFVSDQLCISLCVLSLKSFPPLYIVIFQVLSHNLCTVLCIPHDPVALEDHFRDDDDGPVSSQGYMPYLNKYILDKVSKTQLHFPCFVKLLSFVVKAAVIVFLISACCCCRLLKALLLRKTQMNSVGLLRQRRTTRRTKPAAQFCQRGMLFGFGAFLIFSLRTSTLWLWFLMRQVQLE